MDKCDADARLLSVEADAAVREVAFAVQSISVSPTFPNSERTYRLDLCTLEGAAYCIELTSEGFRVVDGDGRYFETIYSLLGATSPRYRLMFGGALASKLAELAQRQEREAGDEDSGEEAMRH
ncbi:PREDICTED: GSK3-beta interaction protein-like [Priapulus caudatus]|uniref:GSK3-beta interaction protein-like n=1 Tax=Priapulus caudatus TaxID=37621 RepID=A0ABM1EXM8_PRICU|nr:PREDICTED: GSK3-beta interaction protein-like [Priapulus caudatus]